MGHTILSKILEQELLSEDLVEISRGDINDMINYHYTVLSWCARQEDLRDLCRDYMSVVEDTLRALATIRIVKSIQTGAAGGDEVLGIVLRARDLYMRFLRDLPIDPTDRIPVRLLVDIRLGGRRLISRRGYLLPTDLAIRLVVAGLAEPLRSPVQGP